MALTADAALTPYLNRLEMLGFAEMWDQHPQLVRWIEKVKQRASFQPALFQYLPAELRASMEANGRKAWPEIRKILHTSIGD